MSSQTYLTENPPMILDATCSFYRNYPLHATLRGDGRAGVGPDIVMDARFLPFKDFSVDELYLDPPHMIRKDPMILGHDISQIKRRLSGRLSEGDLTRYGFFKSRGEWLAFLARINIEAPRVLKPEGVVKWKLTFGKDSRDIKESDLKVLTNLEIIPERSRITKSKKPGSKNLVSWLTMRPKSAVAAALRKDGGA